jgi:4-diphosphocytidyl-2-C-methyl-D-erythritol kinase
VWCLEQITIAAPAKINLSLDITGKLENGYHALDTIMQTISIEDKITLAKTGRQISVLCDHPQVPQGNGNICHKAAEAFFEKTALEGSVIITIDKNIPVAAGLAGGSSDAAAVIKGLNLLYGTGLTQREMCEIGLKCGADVPYCIVAGTCRAKGIGEKLTKLPSFAGVYIVLVVPDFFVSTEWAYKNYDLNSPDEKPRTEELISYIRGRDIKNTAERMVNVLESVTAKKHPEIQEIKNDIKKSGACGSVMSGSGPSVFGLFENEEKARIAFSVIREKYNRSYLTLTVDGGIKEWQN